MSIYLDYGVFSIYYNAKFRWPDCVIEKFDGFPDQPINRKDFTNKFQPDLSLPPKARMSKDDYDRFLQVGGSYGHNAPASFHKSSPQDYLNTFLLSNVCPQEMTFNSGLWHLCEEWTSRIIKHFKTVTVLTGSIKGEERIINDVSIHIPNKAELSQVDGSLIHIPSAMYKIILIHRDDIVYGCAYLMTNIPHLHESKMSPYIINIPTVVDRLRSENDFDLQPVLDSISLEIQPIESELLDGIRGINGFDLVISKSIKRHLRMAAVYHAVIYAQSLEELEQVVATNKITVDQRVYYELSKIRLS
jgi:DNA/RNA endonuclease G (NUC1)